MIIKILIKDCEHLKEISHHNSNYYKLPFTIKSCDVILENCEEDYDSIDYELGNIIGGRFEQSFIFACDYSPDYCDEVIILDSNLEGRVYT